MADKFTFSSAGLVHELEMAMDRAGGWNSALVKRLCEGDRLVHVREYVLGLAVIKPLEKTVPASSEVLIVRLYPADGEVFALTLDGDAPENQPLEMVRRDGYGNPARRFKLVSIGYCQNWEEVLRRLAGHGRIPEGLCRNAFKNAFKSDGKGPVGVANPSWVNPDGSACFPCVNSDGESSFRWTVSDFSDRWRWLVEVVAR